MPIYVDELKYTRPTAYWRYDQACHLYVFDDPLDKLHEFATKIGLRRSWFQNHDILPHYDLTANRRVVAIRNGAISVTRHQMAEHLRANREAKRKPPEPQ